MNEIKEVKIIEPTLGIEANKIIKMAAYCRVSTDSEDQKNSFLSQVQYYTDFINTHDNMKLIEIYADEGITGTCMEKRDEFKRMMQDCKLGKIDRILVKSVSRFARNSLECLEAIRQLKEYGTSVLFENDNIDTATMNSEMILYIKSAFAQSEALSGAKRVATAYRMKMENGEFLTYHAPFGYRLVEQNLIVVPKEAEIVKRIFQLYVTGHGKSSIAGTLNAEGVIGKKHWTSTMIHYILTNEKYIGDSMVQKTFTPQVFPLRNIPNKGELPKFYIKDTHEAIIEKDLFNAVQEIIKKKATYKKVEKQERLFQRKIICDSCGWAYKHRFQNGKDYWVCSRNGINGYNCSGPNLEEEKIKSAFVRVYNKLRFFEKDILDYTLKMYENLKVRLLTNNQEISSIDSEIKELCEQNDRYIRYHDRKIMDDVSFVNQTDKINQKLHDLRVKRTNILKNDIVEQQITKLKTLKETIQNYPKSIMAFDEDLFNGIVKTIRVEEDGTLIFVMIGCLSLRGKVEIERKWQSEASCLGII